MAPAASDPCGTLFSAECGGAPSLEPHLFWLLGHSEVLSGALIGLGLVGLALFLRYLRNAGRPLPLSVPALWMLGFVLLSIAGGATGLLQANAGAGHVLHDTYYAVAHVHYALSVCAWFAIFAAWYRWFPRMSGRAYSELWARLHFWATFVGACLVVLSQSFLALGGMPRSYPDFRHALVVWKYVASAGSYAAAIGTLFFVVSAIHGRFAAWSRSQLGR